jgi:hypothetical protein
MTRDYELYLQVVIPSRNHNSYRNLKWKWYCWSAPWWAWRGDRRAGTPAFRRSPMTSVRTRMTALDSTAARILSYTGQSARQEPSLISTWEYVYTKEVHGTNVSYCIFDNNVCNVRAVRYHAIFEVYYTVWTNFHSTCSTCRFQHV